MENKNLDLQDLAGCGDLEQFLLCAISQEPRTHAVLYWLVREYFPEQTRPSADCVGDYLQKFLKRAWVVFYRGKWRLSDRLTEQAEALAKLEQSK